MTDTADNAPADEVAVGDNEQSVADAVADNTPKDETDYGFVLDKYKAEGRSDSESAIEQAKAYSELQSKFGSFTGAPESYEVSLSEEVSEGFDAESLNDDPVFQDFKEVAKEMNLSNDGFNKLSELYIKGQMADVQAAEEVYKEELKALGPNADRRLNNIQDWAKMNLDADNSEALSGALTSAAAVQAVEALIAKTRNSLQSQGETSAPGVSHDQVKARLTATDEFGNKKMSDPKYAAETRRLYGLMFGEEPRSVTVGR